MVTNVIPKSRREHVLLEAASLHEHPYIKAPHLTVLRNEEILVGYKRGTRHNREPSADWEVRTLNSADYTFEHCTNFPSPEGASFQNAEFLEYTNGDVEIFLDRQRANELSKKGLVRWRSTDRGASWEPNGEFGNVGGKVYAYAFQGFKFGETDALLATTHRIPSSNSSQVDLLVTDDNGKSWNRHCNLSERFGDGDILNESWIVKHGDGFIIVCRCLDQEIRIYKVDNEFRLLQKRNLTCEVAEIPAYLGRPVLMLQDERIYLMGRNFTAPLQDESRRAFLGFFRINPESLLPESNVVLDNAEYRNVRDGYYARAFWRVRENRRLLVVVTYRLVNDGKDAAGPDLVLLEYDWNEIASL